LPGEIVREECLKALDLTVTEAAKKAENATIRDTE